MIQFIQYNEQEVFFFSFDTLEQAKEKIDENFVSWINISLDLRDEVEKCAEIFQIHHLTIEDILNRTHLPNYESFENYDFITLKQMGYHEGEILQKHVSFILGGTYVLSFLPGNYEEVFREVLNKLQNPQARLRKKKEDYLFYRLIDVLVDQYLSVASDLKVKSESIEEEAFSNGSQEEIASIIDAKRQVSYFERFAYPLRNEILRLRSNPTERIKKTTLTYFKDIVDHLDHILSTLDSVREILRDAMDLHLSRLSFSMNKVMKTLTIVATIFIPLTFIVGVYGMNFPNMPEFHWRWGYLFVWLVMVVVTIVMLIYMKRKKWL